MPLGTVCGLDPLSPNGDKHLISPSLRRRRKRGRGRGARTPEKNGVLEARATSPCFSRVVALLFLLLYFSLQYHYLITHTGHEN